MTLKSDIKSFSTSIIFGGANGIGKAFVDALLANNAKQLFVIDNKIRPSGQNQATVADKRVLNFKADITNEQELLTALSKIPANSIELVLFSAGIRDDSLPELTNNVNFLGTVKCFNAVISLLAPGAMLVFVSSDLILLNEPRFGIESPYIKSKKAVADFAKKTAIANPDLSIITLLPGPVDTVLFHGGKNDSDLIDIDNKFGIMQPSALAARFFEEIMPQFADHTSGDAVIIYKKQNLKWVKI